VHICGVLQISTSSSTLQMHGIGHAGCAVCNYGRGIGLHGGGDVMMIEGVSVVGIEGRLGVGIEGGLGVGIEGRLGVGIEGDWVLE
jgi:hypothetical protein